MRGTIKQRAKGSWTIILGVGREPTTGKRKQQWVTVRDTKRDAERKLAKLQVSIDTGTYITQTPDWLAKPKIGPPPMSVRGRNQI